MITKSPLGAISGSPERRRDFIRANTTLLSPPLVPQICLHLAHEAHDLWTRTEEELQQIGLEPPFWAFAWAGGQALARHVLDNPEQVDGKMVLDLASGSGLVGIAAAMAGAQQVTANDIDPFAIEAVTLNSRVNGVSITTDTTDHTVAAAPIAFNVILAGDVFYDRALAQALWPILLEWASAGKTILIGDPGRAYLPKTGLRQVADFRVPVTRALEDAEIKHTRVLQVVGA